MEAKRPNILFIMTDQHRPDMAGYAGNSVVRTPAIDWIADEGVVFRNAYTPSPVCIPARQSLMSGKLPRTTGCEVFGQDLPPSYQTFARSFSQQAYNTVCCGKLHHNGSDQMQGWNRRIGRDTWVRDPYIEVQDQAALEKEKTPRATLRWSNAKELQKAGIGAARNTKEDLYTLQGALDFIEDTFQSPYYDKPQPNQPVLLKVSFVLPHYPYFCSEDLFKYYLNRVPLFGEDQPVSEHPYLRTKHLAIGEDITLRDIQRTTAAYYAMTETVDGYIGQVLAKLREAGEDLDEWLIVFTADHGEMLGELGVWAKHKFYDSSARVPLVIRYPKKYSAKTVPQNVNLCDIYATLCEICGIPVPDDLDSRSLCRLLEGTETVWSNETISQYLGEHLMIKQDDLKYQYYGEDMPEVLFDLAKNPAESIDYSADPAYSKQMEQFRVRCGQLGFGIQAEPHYKNAGYPQKGGM